MSRQLRYIRDVTPEVCSWSVRVLVEAKTGCRQSSRSARKFQRLTLIDETETRIIAALYDDDIKRFEKTLNLYDTYIISNAKVLLANPEYDNHGNPYQWTINQRTVIKKELHNTISSSLAVPQFAVFNTLQPSQRRETVDVLAIVIQKYEQRRITTASKSYIIHEFAVMNEERRPLMLSLWNNIAISEGEMIMVSTDAMPIIIATKMNVSPHYGLSLGSTHGTTISVDPPIPVAQKLKTWRSNNPKAIIECIAEVDRIIKKQQTSLDMVTKFQSIAEVVKADNQEKFTLKVKAKITNLKQKFYYIGCQKCHASVAADSGWDLDCTGCNQTSIATPREIVMFNVYDDTGMLEVTIFGDQAAKISQMNAVMAMEMHLAGDAHDVHRMNKAIENTTFLVKLKKSYKTKQGGTVAQFTVVSLTEEKRTTEKNTQFESVSQSSSVTLEVPTPTKLKMKRKLLFEDDEIEENESILLKKARASAETSKGQEDTDDVASLQ